MSVDARDRTAAMAGARAGPAQRPVSARSDTLRASVLVAAAATFLAPYALWRVSSEYFITVSDVAFLLAAILMIASNDVHLRPFGSWTFLWLGAFMMMTVGLLIGSLINGDPLRWLTVTFQYGFGFVVLPFVLMSKSEEIAVFLGKALLAGVFAMESFGLVIYYFYGGTFTEHQEIAWEFISGAGRLGAFMGDANWNGAMIAMAVPFALFFWTSGRIGSGVAILLSGVLAIALTASASFTGFASGAAAIATFLLVAGGRSSIKLIIGLVVAAGLVFASGYRPPEVFQKRVAIAISEGDISQAGTFVGRLDLIAEAWTVVEKTSLIGLGVDQYRVFSRQKAPVHNIYLLLWAEGGLLALIGWLIMMLVLGIGSVMAAASDRRAGALGCAVLVTFILFSAAAPHMYARIWVVPLLVAMAIAFAATAEASASTINEYPVRTRESGPIRR